MTFHWHADSRRVRGLTLRSQSKWEKPFFFIQLADPQIGMFNPKGSWKKDLDLLEQAITHVNRLLPRFVIICGDLTNAYPNQPDYDDQVREIQVRLRKINPKIPLICLCGNHDIGEYPAADSIRRYIDNFGDDYFSFWVNGVYCIVINSALWITSSSAPLLQHKQEKWFNLQLQYAKYAKHTILFSHHPLFLQNAKEKQVFFPPWEGKTSLVTWPPTIRDKILTQCRENGIQICFAGHYHANSCGSDGHMEMVTTSAVGKPLGSDPSGLRIVKVYENNIKHTFYGMDNVPKRIEL